MPSERIICPDDRWYDEEMEMINKAYRSIRELKSRDDFSQEDLSEARKTRCRKCEYMKRETASVFTCMLTSKNYLILNKIGELICKNPRELAPLMSKEDKYIIKDGKINA